MALDVTINLNDAREAELVKLTNERNRLILGDQLTPTQFCRSYVREWLDLAIQQRADLEKLGLRTLYKIASPTDQAAIDAILNKYR